MSEADPLIGATIGRYRVDRVIGRGGMGRVYLATQPDIGAEVAIKVVNASANSTMAKRMLAEARAVNIIKHEHIVNVLDVEWLPDGRPAMVMERLDGQSLQQMVRAGPIPVDDVVRICGQVLSALSAAHDRNILHRDLKPANIMVSPKGRAKVLDFGLAKFFGERAGNLALTEQGRVVGTLSYMSPEQLRGDDLDARSDVFAMGLVMYRAATNKKAFVGRSPVELVNALERPPVPPRRHRPDLPEAVERVILRALSYDPRGRYHDARDMLRALDRASSGMRSSGPLGKLVTAYDSGSGSLPASASSSQLRMSSDAASPDSLPARRTRSRVPRMYLFGAIAVLMILFWATVYFVARGGDKAAPAQTVANASELSWPQSVPPGMDVVEAARFVLDRVRASDPSATVVGLSFGGVEPGLELGQRSAITVTLTRSPSELRTIFGATYTNLKLSHVSRALASVDSIVSLDPRCTVAQLLPRMKMTETSIVVAPLMFSSNQWNLGVNSVRDDCP